MTVPATARRAGPYSGNDATTAFGFTFKVFDETDIRVVETTDGVETDATLNSDYTVALNEDQDASPGGTITYLEAPATGTTITLLGNLENSQPSGLPDGGGFRAQSVENALDRLAILIQQQAERVGRTLAYSASDTTVEGAIPSVADRLNRMLGFNAVTGLPAATTFTMEQVANAVAAAYLGGAATTLDAVAFLQTGSGSEPSTAQEKVRERLSVFDKLTAAEKADVLAYGNTVDTTTGIQNLINDAKTRNPIGPAEAVLPAGGYKITDTLVVPKDVILRGEGLDATKIKIVSATAKPAILVEPAPGGYIWGGGVQNLKIDGNTNCDGIKVTANSPSAVSQMAFRDIQIRDVRDGLIVQGTAANEAYINTFENFKITGVSRYGVKVLSAVYNGFYNIEVTGIGDGGFAFYAEGAGSHFRNLTADGCCYFDIPYGSVDHLTVEGITAAIAGAGTCVDFNRVLSARNITLLDIPNAKCNFGVAMRDVGWVLDSVHVVDNGLGKPDFPFGATAGANGVVMNWSGSGAFPIEVYLAAAEMETIKFINCPDLTDGWNGGTRLVAALPTARAGLRGNLLVVKGGAGVADVSYVCRKNAADAYEWQALA